MIKTGKSTHRESGDGDSSRALICAASLELRHQPGWSGVKLHQQHRMSTWSWGVCVLKTDMQQLCSTLNTLYGLSLASVEGRSSRVSIRWIRLDEEGSWGRELGGEFWDFGVVLWFSRRRNQQSSWRRYTIEFTMPELIERRNPPDWAWTAVEVIAARRSVKRWFIVGLRCKTKKEDPLTILYCVKSKHQKREMRTFSTRCRGIS